MSLIFRNIIRAVVIDCTTDFLIFICKLFIIGGIGVLSFFFFSGELAKALPIGDISKALTQFNPDLNYYYVPVIIVVIIMYIVAKIFFSVYSMAVDTLFLCFLQDLEENNGSIEKPYYMSKDLMNILGKKNKQEKKNDKTDSTVNS